MNELKILHTTVDFYPSVGGVQKYAEDLCTNLIKHGYKCSVVCLRKNYSKGRPKIEKYNGIKIYRIPYIGNDYYSLSPTVLSIVKKYDIVHVHELKFFADFLSITKIIHKKPLILSTHGGIFHTKKIQPIKKIYFNLWCKVMLKNFDKIIAVSKQDEEKFSEISDNVAYIPNGINLDEFSSKIYKKEKNTFIYVGRFAPNKRIDNLIKTFYYVKKHIPNFRLFLIGSGPELLTKKLRNLTKKLNLEKNIIFLGRLPQKKLVKYLHKSQYFVSASEYEGFGISVIEAMAAGCIPIVNRLEPFKEFIKNKETGFYVDYFKPENAAKVIIDINNTSHTKMLKNLKITAKKYDWKNITSKIENIYKKVYI